jgi:hypothetical protein
MVVAGEGVATLQVEKEPLLTVVETVELYRVGLRGLRILAAAAAEQGHRPCNHLNQVERVVLVL